MTTESHDYQELYRILVGELGDYAIFLMNIHGQITTWNAGVQRLLGFEEREFLGRPVSIIIYT